MDKKKILISEDDQYIVDFMSHIFRGTNYDAVFARDGYEALQLIPKENPALLILDYMTPKLNAFQLCQELNKNEQYRSIPKIVMTASEKNEIEEGLEKYGIKALVKKPFFANDLMKAIETVLGV